MMKELSLNRPVVGDEKVESSEYHQMSRRLVCSWQFLCFAAHLVRFFCSMILGLGGGCKKSFVLVYPLEVQRLFLEWFLREDRIVLVKGF